MKVWIVTYSMDFDHEIRNVIVGVYASVEAAHAKAREIRPKWDTVEVEIYDVEEAP